jgi:hypothetical protein
MEPEGSLPHSQAPVTCRYPGPDQSGSAGAKSVTDDQETDRWNGARKETVAPIVEWNFLPFSITDIQLLSTNKS